MVASSLSPSHVLGVVSGDLVLRVRGPGRPGQVVRIRSAKCSIGSGARCTLRLDARGVRAVHCVVFRGGERTIVRRWSPDTRLNGLAFTDAELCPGDRLSIGPIELDVLEIDAAQAAREILRPSRGLRGPTDVELAERQATLEQRERDLEQRRQILEQEIANLHSERREQSQDLQAAREQLEADRRQLQTDLERLQAEKQDLPGELERLQAAEEDLRASRDKLRAEEDGLQAAREQIEADRRQLQTELERLQAEKQDLPGEVERLRAEEKKLREEWERVRSQQVDGETLAELRAELAEQRNRLDEERASIQQERAQLDSERASLNAASKTLERESEEWEQRRRKRETEIADRETELDALAAEIRAEPSRVQRDAEAPRASIDEDPFDEEPVEEVKEAAPVALADVLRRLGKSDLLLDDEDESDEDDNDHSTPAAGRSREDVSPVEPRRFPADGAKTHGEQEDGEDDVSVDEYMSQLMRRVRGTTPPRAAPRHVAPERTETPRQTVAAKESRAEPQTPREPVKMTPRAPAPERTGFAAMRELANVSARAAVDQHARRQMLSISRSKLVVAVMASLASAILFWLWTTYLPIGATVLAAATSFAIAILWGLQYAVVTGRLLIGQNGRISLPRVNKRPDQAAEPSDEPSMSTDAAATPADEDADGTEPDMRDE